MKVTLSFFLPDMGPCCDVDRVKKGLQGKGYVASIDGLKKEVKIFLEVTTQTEALVARRQIRAFIEENLNYKCHELRSGPFPHWLQGLLGVGLGSTVLILCVFTAGLPFAVMASIAGISTFLTVIFGFDSFKRAWHQLRLEGRLGMDALFTVSTLFALSTSIASLFLPWLPMMFEVGLFLFGFRHVGLALEVSMDEKIDKELSFQSMLPAKVVVKNGENWEEKALEQVQEGDILQIKAGEILPVDGQVLTEGCLISEAVVCGEMDERATQAGEELFSGIKLARDSKPLELKVMKLPQDSFIAKLDKWIQTSEQNRAPIEDKTRRWLTYFVPVVFLIAAGAGAILSLFSTPALAISSVIAVLVSVCPCTLGLIVPLALKIGVNKADRKGLRFYSAEALERAEHIDTVVFDVSGTLTVGKPQVKGEIKVHDKTVSEDEILQLFYAMEAESYHPIAKAIVAYCHQKGIVKNKLNHVLYKEDGLEVEYEGRIWRVGGQKMMARHHVFFAESSFTQEGEIEVFLSRDDKLVASLILQDNLRDEAVKTITQLRASGKLVYLCTGGAEQTAALYAKRLGIPLEHVRSGCSVKDKQDFIRFLKAEGHHVAMVGDGGNDAVAMAESDLGIFIMSQVMHDMTKAKAGVQVKDKSLKPLQYLFPIVSETFRLIRFNLGVSFAYNILCLLVAAGIFVPIGLALNPVLGAVLMITQVALLLAHAFYVHQKEPFIPEASEIKQREVGLSTQMAVLKSLSQFQQAVVPEPLPDQSVKCPALYTGGSIPTDFLPTSLSCGKL